MSKIMMLGFLSKIPYHWPRWISPHTIDSLLSYSFCN